MTTSTGHFEMITLLHVVQSIARPNSHVASHLLAESSLAEPRYARCMHGQLSKKANLMRLMNFTFHTRMAFVADTDTAHVALINAGCLGALQNSPTSPTVALQ